MQRIALLLTCFAMGTLAFAQGPRDPIGETAFFLVDKAPARTSWMIKNGNFTGLVVGESTESEEPAYTIKLSYDFDVQIYGHQVGEELIDVPKTYFSEAFLQQLRTDINYETADFKIQHQGFATARNMDGRVYENTDVLLFYDIKVPQQRIFQTMFHQWIFGTRPAANSLSEIKDLKLRAHVKYGIPVLGAVKLDMSGTYDGVFIKAGSDYEHP